MSKNSIDKALRKFEKTHPVTKLNKPTNLESFVDKLDKQLNKLIK